MLGSSTVRARLAAIFTSGVRELPLPSQDAKVVARFPVAVVEGAPSPEWAGRFIEYLISREGQRVLTRHGFESPVTADLRDDGE